jgi:hypothetical protein
VQCIDGYRHKSMLLDRRIRNGRSADQLSRSDRAQESLANE